MAELNWEPTTQRFVAFFDILGFKDLVARKQHAEILEKLNLLKTVIEELQTTDISPIFKTLRFSNDQTKAITFSDSIVFFSNSDTKDDASKILFDSYRLLLTATRNKIPIKGCISFGKITVDFSTSLFFGQPIIDAFLLHEDLIMLSVIIDNSAEEKINSFSDETPNVLFNAILKPYKCNMKSGKINHKLISPLNNSVKTNLIDELTNLYSTCSGRPRLYIDNTIEYLESLKFTF